MKIDPVNILLNKDKALKVLKSRLLDLEIEKGDTIGIIGASGKGKTTFFNFPGSLNSFIQFLIFNKSLIMLIIKCLNKFFYIYLIIIDKTNV